MKNYKIAFLTRYDAFTKFGGDTYQISIYKKYWEERGHIVDIITSAHFEKCYDLYIVVNVDRFLETFYFLKLLYKNNLLKKTAILPIHHSFTSILNFELKYRSGLLKHITRFFGVFGKEKSKSLALALRKKSFLPSAFNNIFLDESEFLSNINRDVTYIFLAQGEKLLFEKDFNIQVRNYVLTKNGCDVKDKDFISNLHKDIDIIISGRIEPRKNSINLLRVLGGINYKVKFVGSLNKNNKSYTDEFLSLVKGYDNIDYLGSVTHDDMQSLFKRSKIHISASWFEVSSLVDLEAYFLGCHVISSTNGNTNEFIKKNIDFINPEDLSCLNDLLKDILINYTVPKVDEINERFSFIKENHNWKSNSDKLIADLFSLG